MFKVKKCPLRGYQSKLDSVWIRNPRISFFPSIAICFFKLNLFWVNGFLALGSWCRIVLGLKKYDHITEGLKSLNWLNVNDRLLVNDLLMVHKCIHDLIPSYLTGKFIQRSKIHGRNTRGSGELDLPICRLKTGQRSFAFRGAKLYNNLPNEIKQTSDVKKFKAKVCNYLLNL